MHGGRYVSLPLKLIKTYFAYPCYIPKPMLYIYLSIGRLLYQARERICNRLEGRLKKNRFEPIRSKVSMVWSCKGCKFRKLACNRMESGVQEMVATNGR